MDKKILDEWFKENFLKGTCFEAIKELQDDKTDVDINAPRALIACNLQGAYSAVIALNAYIESNKK